MPTRNRAVRIPEKLRVVMGVQIDEAGHDDHAAGVDHLVCLRCAFQIADLRDLAVLDTDVGLITRQPRAVDHHSTSDDYVEFRHEIPF